MNSAGFSLSPPLHHKNLGELHTCWLLHAGAEPSWLLLHPQPHTTCRCHSPNSSFLTEIFPNWQFHRSDAAKDEIWLTSLQMRFCQAKWSLICGFAMKSHLKCLLMNSARFLQRRERYYKLQKLNVILWELLYRILLQYVNNILLFKAK